MKKIEVTCANCGQRFVKSISEYNRSERLGRQHFCDLRCSGAQHTSHLKQYIEITKKNIIPGRISDEYSPFRGHLRNIKTHAEKKKQVVDITLQDLLQQWNKQRGICPYTGWKLINPKNTTELNNTATTPDRASVDRIDSSKGYTKDNIQFVSLAAQFAKHKWTEEQFIKFCCAVAQNMRV